MSEVADLLYEPATDLAGMIRSGQISARELVAASLERIEELNPAVNAFVDVDHRGALRAAEQVSGADERPFAGVPVAIKNNRAVAGMRLTLAAEFTGDFVPDYDHNVVRRLKQAGFIVVGTTTLPEWGILPTSEARRFGPTRNPWDLERTPGGSSGGSAAAVAAGMVPVAHGNDGGGSTRIPAACCGLVGLKPQRGRISLAPEAGQQFLVCDGMLTRTVAETARLLDVLAGPELGDASWAPPPPQPFASAAERPPGRLRIAATTLPAVPDTEVDPVCSRAVADAAGVLSELGHEIVEEDPPWQIPDVMRTFTASFGPAICTQIAWMAMVQGRQPAETDMEPLSWAIWNLCQGINSIEAAGAELQLQAFARAIIGWADGFDAILTPALAEAPVKLGTIDSCAADPMASFARSGQFTPYTAICNVSGQPAIALPLFEREDGLPLAVQLIGRPAQEGALLALAGQLEQACPWHGRRAPVQALAQAHARA